MAEIGAKIKKARKAAGLTQSELGKLINKSLRVVQKYESGEIEPSVSMLKAIARILDVSLAYLLDIPHPLSHVMLIEVVHELGPYKMDEVVLFNINRITEYEVKRHIEAGAYNDNILCIPKSQWVSLFLDGKE